MPTIPNKLTQIWQELKRRKVTRVITIYAAAAFVILQLVEILAPSLRLPEWTMNFILVLLIVGFIITVIVSWIYDIHPEGGIVKTEPSKKVTEESVQPSSKGWKIISYVSFMVIIVLIVINIIPRKSQSADALNLGASIGVLPFENLSGDPELEHFCVGMTDAVISRLSKLNGLDKVPSRTSMMRYKKNEKTIPEIADELEVTYILESAFLKSGNEIKISLNLVDGQSDKAFWSEEYLGKYDDIFTIQAKVAEIVASNLNVDITEKELADIRKSMTENVEAYNLYSKAVFETRNYTTDGNNRAINYFESAIALDSTFASAFAGLASCYIGLASVHSSELSALDALKFVKPLVNKALSLDPDLDEAHLWNGMYLLYNNWDFIGAELEYRRAIADESPNSLMIYTDLLNFTGRHEEALKMAERLVQTDPLYPNGRVSVSLYYVGEFEKAKNYAKSRVEMFKNYYSLDMYGFILLNTGDYEYAIQLFNNAIESISERTPRMIGWMGAAYAKLGNKEKSAELIEELKLKKEQSLAGAPAFYIAVIYAALGNKELALEWLQDAYENHEMEMPWLKSEPQFYTLHDEPAFQDLLNKVGFPRNDGDLPGK